MTEKVLTKDTLINGKVIKEGTKIQIGGRVEKVTEGIGLFPNLSYGVNSKGVNYFELMTFQPAFTYSILNPKARSESDSSISLINTKDGQLINVTSQDTDEIIVKDSNREGEPTEFELIMKSGSRIAILLND